MSRIQKNKVPGGRPRERRQSKSDNQPGRRRQPRAGRQIKSSKQPGRRLRPQERRQQLLDLGLRLFSSRAIDEVSIEDVAAELGISKGLLYHYFPSKRQFMLETLRHASGQLYGHIRAAVAGAGDLPPERLRAALSAYLEFVEQHADAYASVLRSGAGIDPRVSEILEQGRDELVDEAFEGLGLSAPTPAQRLLVYGWIGFVEAASLRWLEQRVVEREELLDLLTAQLLTALRPSDPGGVLSGP